MKLVNFIFGMVIFSIVATMMFAAVQSIIIKNNYEGADEWEELSGEYGEFIGEVGSNKNSTIRQVQDQTGFGAATSEDKDTSLIKGAISGGRLSFNFFTNFDDVINKVNADTTKGASIIDDRIIGALTALVVLFLALVVLHFLRGFKTEV